MKKLIFLLLALVFLCGCAPNYDVQFQEISDKLDSLQTQVNDLQEQVDQIPIPTPTPEPTPEPEATLVPVTRTISTEEIAEALVDAGLPIAKSVTYTAETDPNEMMGKPHAYLGKTNCWDSRIGTGSNDDCVMIEAFATVADARARMQWVENHFYMGLTYSTYCIQYDVVLVRFDHEFSAEQVKEYTDVLETILGMPGATPEPVDE